jgi:hypothetical protein
MKILLFAALLLSSVVWASDPCKISSDKILDALLLKYQEFDQTPGKGFRELHAKGCYLSAAILIDIWHLNSLSSLKPIESSATYFHAGQNYAYQSVSFYPIAIQRFEKALLSDELAIREFKSWNPFVSATIAFFKKDKPLLKKKREELGRLPKDSRTDAFIVAVDSLLKDFDKPYLGDQPKSLE